MAGHFTGGGADLPANGLPNNGFPYQQGHAQHYYTGLHTFATQDFTPPSLVSDGLNLTQAPQPMFMDWTLDFNQVRPEHQHMIYRAARAEAELASARQELLDLRRALEAANQLNNQAAAHIQSLRAQSNRAFSHLAAVQPEMARDKATIAASQAIINTHNALSATARREETKLRRDSRSLLNHVQKVIDKGQLSLWSNKPFAESMRRVKEDLDPVPNEASAPMAPASLTGQDVATSTTTNGQPKKAAKAPVKSTARDKPLKASTKMSQSVNHIAETAIAKAGEPRAPMTQVMVKEEPVAGATNAIHATNAQAANAARCIQGLQRLEEEADERRAKKLKIAHKEAEKAQKDDVVDVPIGAEFGIDDAYIDSLFEEAG